MPSGRGNVVMLERDALLPHSRKQSSRKRYSVLQTRAKRTMSIKGTIRRVAM